MQPDHMLTDMNWAEDRIGPKRAKNPYPWKTFFGQGTVLAEVRITMQVDIGFGDAVYPESELASFSALLSMGAPLIRAYPREAAMEQIPAVTSIWTQGHVFSLARGKPYRVRAAMIIGRAFLRHRLDLAKMGILQLKRGHFSVLYRSIAFS